MSFQHRRSSKLLMMICLMIAMTLAISSCGGGGGGKKNSYRSYSGPTTSGTLVINSVNEGQDWVASGFSGSFKSMDVGMEGGNGHICSGPPQSFTVVLKQIRLHTSQGDSVVWSGSKPLTLTGSGQVPLDDVNLDGIPTVPITSVILTFNTTATIKGTLTNITFGDETGPITVSTKSTLAYNAVSHSGGADTYNDFTTVGVEDTNVSLDGYGSETIVTTPCNFTYDGITKPTVTLLFDLSRMLRFYNGKGGGVNPADPAAKAYFFCHSVFRHSVAGFIGTIGKIQGYETNFTGPGNVKGWMTLILDEEGHFLAGNLIGDDDNDLTIAKGWITSFTGTGSYNATYEIGAEGGGKTVFTLDDFEIVTGKEDSSTSHWSSTNGYTGNATFTLKLQVP